MKIKRFLLLAVVVFVAVFLLNRGNAQKKETKMTFEECVKDLPCQNLSNEETLAVFRCVFPFKVKNFPLGKFCGEFLPQEEKDNLKTELENNFDRLEECLALLPPEGEKSLTLKMFGGGFSDAVEFFRKLDVEHLCQHPKIESVNFLYSFAISDDHVRLGLLRMLTAGNLFDEYFTDYLDKKKNKYLTKEKIKLENSRFRPYGPYGQDQRAGAEFRRAEFMVELSLTIYTPKPPPPPEIIEEPEVKAEPEESCKLKIGGRTGFGILSPFGPAINTFYASPFGEFEFPFELTCFKGWSLSPAIIGSLGYQRVPYEGTKNQIFWAYGAGLRLRRIGEKVLWNKDLEIGAEVRWMSLMRHIFSVETQQADSWFVGYLFNLKVFQEWSLEARLGILSLKINQASAVNFYSEFLFVIPLF